ncbi:unnamed protein product, partial [Larinioides sclopetarius]
MENLRFDDNPQVKSLLRETNVVVSEHPPEDSTNYFLLDEVKPELMVETLKTILEGTGTFVHKKMSGDEYLHPTPVII